MAHDHRRELPPVKGIWPVTTHVIKPEGYPFPGEVRAVFWNKAGELRYVVESDAAPGLMHIFSPIQLEKREAFVTFGGNHAEDRG